MKIILCIILHFCVIIKSFRPYNIAHRGSSGMYPEHTIEGYKAAIAQGADIIECDVSITKDLKLVCLHESWLNATSDVSEHPEFFNRVRTIDVPYHGIIKDWFSFDFTLEELKTLRKMQHRRYRDQTFNRKFELATLDEYLNLALLHNKTIGIYPEIKDPILINSQPILNGSRFEDLIINKLTEYGYTNKSDFCFVQSFDFDSLKYASEITSLRMIQLSQNNLDENELKSLSRYAYGVGIWKDQIVSAYTEENGYKNYLGKSTNFISRAHSNNLKVHIWTLRNENHFLAHNYGQDPYEELRMFINLGVDGLFTDFPQTLSNLFKYYGFN